MRILLSRLRPVGDVIFTTPLISALRRHRPGLHLTYLAEPIAAEVLQDNPEIDELRVVPHSRGMARVRDDLSIARRLLADRFDIAIDLHGGPRSAWFTWASRAAMRIGYQTPGRAWMYTHTVPRSRQLTARHSVWNQWDLLSPLGIPHGQPSDYPVRMGTAEGRDSRVADRLNRAGVTSADQLIVVHVSASNRFKRWPEASFVTLVVGLLRRNPTRRVFLTSGPSDTGAAMRVAESARLQLEPGSGRVLDLGSDTLDLADLRSIVTRSAAYVGGDSGPMHVAATTHVPIVGLLGPTLEGRSRPWRDARWFTEMLDAGDLPCRPCNERVCAAGDFRCLTTINPNRVLAAVERALDASATAAHPDVPPGRNERRIPLVQA